jgi:hypothetical protein
VLSEFNVVVFSGNAARAFFRFVRSITLGAAAHKVLRPGIFNTCQETMRSMSAVAGPESLSPTQRLAHDQLVAASPAGSIFEVRCKPGRGRTTVLAAVRAALGGPAGWLQGCEQKMGLRPLDHQSMFSLAVRLPIIE